MLYIETNIVCQVYFKLFKNKEVLLMWVLFTFIILEIKVRYIKMCTYLKITHRLIHIFMKKIFFKSSENSSIILHFASLFDI